MFTHSLIVLSYHKFVDEPDDYRFSRTYDQFYHDIRKKIYDWITIDDGMRCMIKACEMLKEANIRAKLFIPTSLVGKEGYCTWDELNWLARWHDIENHSHVHQDHSKSSPEFQLSSIKTAQMLIEKNIGRKPRYFVAPYNQFNCDTGNICSDLGIALVEGRETILNFSK